MPKPCFIIAHKYFRGYESYLKYYIENIQKHYPDALTVVVDNNSKYSDDVFRPVRDKDNLILLENDIESKFELGAYQVGIRYVLENNLLDEYDYFVMTQDNFVLKNKYDFNILKDSNRTATPINSFYADGECAAVVNHVMGNLQMNDNWDKVNFCWCSSFIVAKEKLKQLQSYLEKIVVRHRWESAAGERYLARLLWELNDREDCGDIDGSAADLAVRHYDTWTVNIHDDATSYFVKKVQQKTENTVDKEESQPIVHLDIEELKNQYRSED